MARQSAGGAELHGRFVDVPKLGGLVERAGDAELVVAAHFDARHVLGVRDERRRGRQFRDSKLLSLLRVARASR